MLVTDLERLRRKVQTALDIHRAAIVPQDMGTTMRRNGERVVLESMLSELEHAPTLSCRHCKYRGNCDVQDFLEASYSPPVDTPFCSDYKFAE